MGGKRKGTRRPVQWVRHPETQQEIPGLRFHKPSSRYYRISGGRRVYYARNGQEPLAYLLRAIYEHRLFLQGSSAEPLAIIPIAKKLKVTHLGDPEPIGELEYVGHFNERGEYEFVSPIHKVDFHNYVRSILLDPIKRHEFAIEIGIPELAYLDRLKPAGSSITLEYVSALYLNKQPPLTKKSILEYTKLLAEFRTIVDVDKVSELTAIHFRTYRDKVLSQEKSPRYAKKRFMLIKTALAHALTEGTDNEHVDRALSLAKVLKNPRIDKPNPVPISVEDFAALLRVADARWKAILLLSLNCAFYPIDICTLRYDAIDLEKQTLRNTRTKTGVPRIATCPSGKPG